MIVYIVRDEFAPRSSWEEFETDDPVGLLYVQIGGLPENARLYHSDIAKSNDITPEDENDLDALAKLKVPLIAVLHAGGDWDFATWASIAAAVIGVAGTVASLLIRPPTPGNQQAPSSNNALGERTNQARPGGRVPDIFGPIEAVPDLIGVPLRMFEDNTEFELAPMCLGRSRYSFGVSDVRDGGTPVSEIGGASIEVYGPFTSPNSGDAPVMTIGDPIGTPITTVYKIDGVNGQTLIPPNFKKINSATTGVIRFLAPNRIECDDPAVFNFNKYYEVGDDATLTGATDTRSGQTVHLDGTYTIDAISDDGTQITLHDVTSVTTDWNKLDLMTDDRTNPVDNCIINADTDSKEVGPFLSDLPSGTQAVLNLVAMGGMFKTDGKKTVALSVDVDVKVTPVDAAGAPTGPTATTTFTMPGSAVDRSQRGFTAVVPISGPVTISVVRKTDTDYAYDGTVSDEIKLRDLYITAPIVVTDFGDVTTIWARQSVTPAALGVKERKLTIRNCCRMVPARDGDGFSDTLVASSNAADIFCAIALDPYLGRRAVTELNVPQIRGAIDEVIAYFGSTAAGSFGFSFDDDQITAEDMLTAVAQACFCEPVRRGSRLELVFERPTDDSSLLLNHRNIVPDSQSRAPMFGRQNRYDGADVTYIDGANGDTPKTIRIPGDGSARNPQKATLQGVRDFNVATWQAWRLYNKARWQRLSADLTAQEEARILTRLERILVTDTTAPFDHMSGDVVSQDGNLLNLSQETRFDDNIEDYVILLQYPDGTLGDIDVTPGAKLNQVLLATPPEMPLSTDIRNTTRAKYWIMPADSGDFGRAFLVTEKGQAGPRNQQLSLINYDGRYYDGDLYGRPGLLNLGDPMTSIGPYLLDLVG